MISFARLGAGTREMALRQTTRGNYAVATLNETRAPILAADAHYVRIRPSSGWMAVQWREIWDRRELLYFLAWRDVKVRYKQTLLGAAWAVLVPLMTIIAAARYDARVLGRVMGLSFAVANVTGGLARGLRSDERLTAAEALRRMR